MVNPPTHRDEPAKSPKMSLVNDDDSARFFDSFVIFLGFLFQEVGEGTSHVGCGSPFRLMNPPSI